MSMRSVELRNDRITVRIIDHGATITHLFVKDRYGVERDVVLGYDQLEKYSTNPFYYGCTVGRVANRIAKGRFRLPSAKHCEAASTEQEPFHQLVCNNGPNALHGGPGGFSSRQWTVLAVTDQQATFELVSIDGEEGYPGELRVTVMFQLIEARLRIDYRARIPSGSASVARGTIVNLTNHSYFNLSGGQQATILEHWFHSTASDGGARYLELDDTVQIPTGRIIDGAAGGGPMDFHTQPRQLGHGIRQLPNRGYDHCYLTRPIEQAGTVAGGTLVDVARLWCEESGIQLLFRTTTPGYQLYTANWVAESEECKPSRHPSLVYGQWSGVCLEAQAFPDAINRPEWAEQVILPADGEYRQTTEYEFSSTTTTTTATTISQ